jgi:integrase
MFLILERVADQTNAHLPTDERMKVSPHVLRHTVLRTLAEEQGGRFTKEASGHESDRYIWRSVKLSPQSLGAAIDELDA